MQDERETLATVHDLLPDCPRRRVERPGAGGCRLSTLPRLRGSSDEMTPERLIEARFVASHWYDGQTDPLYAFLSTGAITVGLAATAARRATLAERNGLHEDAEILRELATYADEHGERDD